VNRLKLRSKKQSTQQKHWSGVFSQEKPFEKYQGGKGEMKWHSI
jgi:hypothetical protein